MLESIASYTAFVNPCGEICGKPCPSTPVGVFPVEGLAGGTAVEAIQTYGLGQFTPVLVLRQLTPHSFGIHVRHLGGDGTGAWNGAVVH